MFDRLGDESDLGDLSDLCELETIIAKIARNLISTITKIEPRILKQPITVVQITTQQGELK